MVAGAPEARKSGRIEDDAHVCRVRSPVEPDQSKHYFLRKGQKTRVADPDPNFFFLDSGSGSESD